MNNKIKSLIFSIALFSLSLAALIGTWDSKEKWRHDFALAGSIIFFLLLIVSVYNLFQKRKS